MFPAFLVPDPRQASELEEAIRAQFQIIRQEKERLEVPFIPVNVGYAHDPEWRTRLMSIQAAADAAAGKAINFWTLVAVLFYAANVSFIVGGILIAFGYLR